MRGVLAVVPCQAFGDEDLVEGAAIGEDHGGDEAAVTVAGLGKDGDGLAEGELGGSLGGAAVERLAGFGAIDAVEADADLAALEEDREGVAIGDGDDARLEGMGEGGLEKEEEGEQEGGGHESILRFCGAVGGGSAGREAGPPTGARAAYLV